MRSNARRAVSFNVGLSGSKHAYRRVPCLSLQSLYLRSGVRLYRRLCVLDPRALWNVWDVSYVEGSSLTVVVFTAPIGTGRGRMFAQC